MLASLHSIRFPVCLFLMLTLAGCASLSSIAVPQSEAQIHAEQLYRQGELEQAAVAFQKLANTSSGHQSAHYRLRAAEAWREVGDLDAAARELEGVKRKRLHGDEPLRLDLLDAEIALKHGDMLRARNLLVFPDTELPASLRVRALELQARAEAASGDRLAAAATRARLNRWLTDADRKQNQHEIIDMLSTFDVSTLKVTALALPADDVLRPWLEQVLRKKGGALPRTLPAPNRSVDAVPPETPQTRQPDGIHSLRRVALLLPSSGALDSVAQSIRDGFFTAYFADTHEPRPTVRVYDTGTTSSDTVAAYQQAVRDGADFVVGPLERGFVGELFQQRLSAPVLALNHPDTGETPPPGSAEFGLLPDAEGAQAAEHMLERGIRRAAVIAADADWAERAALAFRAQFEARGGHITGEARLSNKEVNYATAIRQATGLLGKGADEGVFISLHPQQARLLLPQMKLIGANLAVFATSHIYAGETAPGMDRDLDGVEFCDAPWLFGDLPGYPNQIKMARQLADANGSGARLFAFGMDAYNLLPYMGRLIAHPDTYFEGATGQLTIDHFGRVHRSLTWARFDKGIAYPIQTVGNSYPGIGKGEGRKEGGILAFPLLPSSPLASSLPAP